MIDEKIISRRKERWDYNIKRNLEMDEAPKKLVNATYEYLMGGELANIIDAYIESGWLADVNSIFGYTSAENLQELNEQIGYYCVNYLNCDYSKENLYYAQAKDSLGVFFSRAFSHMESGLIAENLIMEMADLIAYAQKGSITYDIEFPVIGKIEIPVNPYSQALYLCRGFKGYLFSLKKSLRLESFKKYTDAFVGRLNEIDDAIYSTKYFDNKYFCKEREVEPFGLQRSMRGLISNIYGYMNDINVDEPEDFSLMDEEVKDKIKLYFDRKSSEETFSRLLKFIKKHNGLVLFESE